MARYITTGTKSSFGAINTELEKIATAQEDFVSRVGETPNQMEADFDMNGNKLLNVPAPTSPTDIVRLKDVLPAYNKTKSNYTDIRDFGAVPNDPTFDNSIALGLALTAANSVETVLLEGGVYYFKNVVISQKCLLGGSATICPISTYNNTAPLFTLEGDLSQVKDLTFDMLGTASYPLKITSSQCVIKDLVVKNISATPNTSTSAAAVHLTGAGASRNTVEGITVIDCINVSASNPSIPRCITIDGGASYNTILDIAGYNIAAGLVHGTGTKNTLNGFTFDNSKATDSEQRNGIYSLEGCSYLVAMNGVINNSAQPIVDKSLGNIYKDIIEIDSNADGVSNSTDATWDNVTKIFTDNAPNGGFLRTRGDNAGYTVDNLTIKNCRIVAPNHYTSIFTFDTGTVDNLRVEGNVFITENVDTVAFRNIILHTAGENPQYIGNTFVLKNPETPYTTLQSWIIRFPTTATTGKWIRNSLESEAVNGVIRVTSVLNNIGVAVDDQNQLRADFGTPYLQSGYTGRLLRGFIPPNSGAWNRGDTISNSIIDSTPPTGYDYQKYAFFICTESGDFADINNLPEFSLIGDSSTAPTFAQVVRPVITSPTEGQVINGTSATIVASGFGGTAGQVHASTNWQVATDSSFSTLVFSSFNDTVNLLSINATGLPTSSTLYVRCLMTSTSGIVSPQSAAITFTTV